MLEVNTQRATILLVDDDQDALQLLTMVMSRDNHTVIQAATGEEAIRQAITHHADIEVIILDLMMPGDIDGYAVCDSLKANPKTRSLPVIILSAKSSARDMARSYAAGAFQHITKPYDIDHLLAVVKSMVRLRRLEREAFTNADKYRAIVDNSPLEMLLISPDFHIMEMNKAFMDAFPNSAIGENPLEAVYNGSLKNPDSHPTIVALQTGTDQSGIVEGKSGGNPVFRHVRATPLTDENGNVISLVEITEDVTEQRQLQERLRRQVDRHERALHQQDLLAEGLMNAQRQLKQKNRQLEDLTEKLELLSITDDLTTLFNKRHFSEAIAQECRRSSRYSHPLSLLMMDIDHFKEVNDTHGHPAGDKVLKKLGEIFHELLRETDTIARYGGEEFAAILPETDPPTALTIGERLRDKVATQAFQISEAQTLSITISIGVTSVQSNDIDPDILIQTADTALYKAKHEGRNRVIASEM